jgi:hypothetical protein
MKTIYGDYYDADYYDDYGAYQDDLASEVPTRAELEEEARMDAYYAGAEAAYAEYNDLVNGLSNPIIWSLKEAQRQEQLRLQDKVVTSKRPFKPPDSSPSNPVITSLQEAQEQDRLRLQPDDRESQSRRRLYFEVPFGG